MNDFIKVWLKERSRGRELQKIYKQKTAMVTTMTEQNILNGSGIVYGLQNAVMAGHPEMDVPARIASRFNGNKYGRHVTALAFVDGTLYGTENPIITVPREFFKRFL